MTRTLTLTLATMLTLSSAMAAPGHPDRPDHTSRSSDRATAGPRGAPAVVPVRGPTTHQASQAREAPPLTLHNGGLQPVQVSIDGRRRQHTVAPGTALTLPHGQDTATVRIVRPTRRGAVVTQQTVRVHPRQGAVVELATGRRAAPAQVAVTFVHHDHGPAFVMVDGVEVARLRPGEVQTLSLSAGTHHVAVRSRRGQVVGRAITLHPGTSPRVVVEDDRLKARGTTPPTTAVAYPPAPPRGGPVPGPRTRASRR